MEFNENTPLPRADRGHAGTNTGPYIDASSLIGAAVVVNGFVDVAAADAVRPQRDHYRPERCTGCFGRTRLPRHAESDDGRA